MDNKEKPDKVVGKEKAFAQMARSCSRKEYAPFDIERKLKRMNLPDSAVREIIGRLKKEHYLNEERFIRSYVHDKFQFNKWGKRKIVTSLQQKQLPLELIERVFSDISEISFKESLLPLLQKKWKSVKGNSDYEKKGKLIRYALNRGFSMDEVMECIRKMQISDFADEVD